MFLGACGGDVFYLDGGVDSGTDATKSDAATDAATDASTDTGKPACDGGCGFGFHCCDDSCVNENNDPLNCGGCGTKCTGSTSMCLVAICGPPTCQPTCQSGEQCCEIQGPGPSGPPQCVQGTTCPLGCPACN